MSDQEISQRCRRCGKEMAAQRDALCCSCRYGPLAFAGYRSARSDHDAYEHMTIIPIGYRLYWADDWFSSQ